MSGGISAALTMASPPVPAPTGHVTLVATSVVGGRTLWDADPEAMSAALRLSSGLIKRLLVEHRGYEVRADGDSALVVFNDPLTAVRWCLDVQEALLEAEWPEALLHHAEASEVEDHNGGLIFRGLRLGMGVHAGTPDVIVDERTRRTEYEGPDVGWVGKVVEVAQGGQIVLTAAAWAGVEEAGAHLIDADVTDLGRHRFAGREDAQPLLQLLPWRLANRAFQDIRTSLRTRTNLPGDPGLFVGRDRLLEAIDRYYQKGRKVVTLKGPGGMGKTRLAMRYGGLHVHEYADAGGVWLCDLSEARSIDGIVHAVARALRISVTARSMKGTQQLGAALATRGRCLLILDNFEQVERYAAYTVELWARKAPRVRILVTSRHKLGVQGEAVCEITPLDTDDAEALFRARVATVRPDLDLSDDDGKTILDILDRVECVPLAVEMAASWTSMLTVEGIKARLDGGQKKLEGVEREGQHIHPRHTSLAEVMRSSWELLAPWEQEALVSCSTFRGGWTAEAANEVVELERYRNAPSSFTVLKSLRDKSLIYTAEAAVGAGRVRWNMYDAAREFCEERLVALGLRPSVEARHARVYLSIARTELERIDGPEARSALAELGAETDNLLAVHQRFLKRQPQLSIQAALALDRVLAARGPFDLHLAVLDGAVSAGLNIKGTLQIPARLARVEALLQRGRLQEASEGVAETFDQLKAGDGADTRAWVQALSGWVLSRMGKTEDGLTALKGAQEAFKISPRRGHAPTCSFRLGVVLLESGTLEEAGKQLHFAEMLCKTDNRWLHAEVLAQLGNLDRRQGQPERAEEHYTAALAIHREHGDRPREGRVLSLLGGLAIDLRQNEEAERCFVLAKERAEEIGDVVEAAVILGNLGRMRHHEGRGKEAEAQYDEALRALRGANALRWVGIYQGVLGALQHEQGRIADALASYTGALTLLEAAGDKRFAGLVLARLGALRSDEGHVSPAAENFEKSEAYLKEVNDPLGMAALQVHRGHLDLARARAGRSELLKDARERFRAATTPQRNGEKLVQPPAAISNDVRLALRLLRRSMELGQKK